MKCDGAQDCSEIDEHELSCINSVTSLSLSVESLLPSSELGQQTSPLAST